MSYGDLVNQIVASLGSVMASIECSELSFHHLYSVLNSVFDWYLL